MANGTGTTLSVTSGSVLYSGTNGDIPATGAGTRMMWYPAKSAFRAGLVTGTQWDDANIGAVSVAMGIDSKASGIFSLALGAYATATGASSNAIGLATASGDDSLGISNGPGGVVASGLRSMAIGNGVTASGDYSYAIGYDSITSNTGSYVFGRYASATAAGAMTIGVGVGTAGNRLVNNTANSLGIGFNTTVPTLSVGPGSGAGTAGSVSINGTLSVSGGITGPMVVDAAGANTGTVANSLRFGSVTSGETIGSKRDAGGNQYGLDLYTNSAQRMYIKNGGQVYINGGNNWNAAVEGDFNIGTTYAFSIGIATSGGGSGDVYMTAHGSGTDRIFLGTEGNTQALTVNGTSGTIALNGGHLILNNGTSNAIEFGANGVAAPGVNSAGAKIILYGAGSGMSAVTSYAIGIEGNTMWFNSDDYFKWYVDAALVMSTDSTGGLTLNGGLNKGLNIVGTSPTIMFKDTTPERTSYIHVNSSRMYFLSGVAGSGEVGWTQDITGYYPLYIDMATNTSYFGGNITTYGYSGISIAQDTAGWGGSISMGGTQVLAMSGGAANDVYANIRVRRGASMTDGMYIGYGGAGGPLRFFGNAGGTEHMTINSNGSVLINSAGGLGGNVPHGCVLRFWSATAAVASGAVASATVCAAGEYIMGPAASCGAGTMAGLYQNNADYVGVRVICSGYGGNVAHSVGGMCCKM